MLWLENRGGPAFTVRLGEGDVATIPCNGGGRLVPGAEAVPPLPWNLTLIRVRDGATLMTREITTLPLWFVQIGEHPLGFSESPVLGPPGPTCPPTG